MRSIDFAPAQASFIYLFIYFLAGRRGGGLKKNNGFVHHSIIPSRQLSLFH